MEVDEDCLIIQDESEGIFGLRIKADPDAEPDTSQSCAELFQDIEDYLNEQEEEVPAVTEPEPKKKYGFIVKKKVQAPMNASNVQISSSTAQAVTPVAIIETSSSTTPMDASNVPVSAATNAPRVANVCVSAPPTMSIRSTTATSSTPMDTMPEEITPKKVRCIHRRQAED